MKEKNPKCEFCKLEKEHYINPKTGEKNYRWKHQTEMAHPQGFVVEKGMIPLSTDELEANNEYYPHNHRFE